MPGKTQVKELQCVGDQSSLQSVADLEIGVGDGDGR